MVERLLAVRERADTLHRAVVPHSERSEANTAKIAAANRQRQLEAPPPEGYNLHPEDRRLLAQREPVEQLTVEWQRLEAQNERAVAAWQPAARVRSVCEEFLRDRPPNTAVEDAPTEPPKLAKGESLLDAIERIRHRGRELPADANRISSSPYPSSWAKAQVRAQVAGLAQRGAPDVTLLVELGGDSVTWPMQNLQSAIHNADRAAVGFTAAPDAVALFAWAFGDQLVAWTARD